MKNVTPDSPAARAGVKPGMVLDGIDGAKVGACLLEPDSALTDTESRRLRLASSRAKAGQAPQMSPVKLRDLLDCQRSAKARGTGPRRAEKALRS